MHRYGLAVALRPYMVAVVVRPVVVVPGRYDLAALHEDRSKIVIHRGLEQRSEGGLGKWHVCVPWMQPRGTEKNNAGTCA